MANLSPYITFENTKDAMRYYEEVFGANNLIRVPVQKEVAEKFFNIPDNEIENTTIYGSFSIEGNLVLCADSFGRKAPPNEFISILLNFNSEDAADSKKIIDLYNRLAESGEVAVTMPLEKHFLGGEMAILTDKYGITWMLHSQPYSKLH